jgi:hypothetical protein
VKAFLLYQDRDFDVDRPLPANAADLAQDLGLEPVLAAMAAGDEFLYQVAGAGLFASLESPEEISYRQQVLADCISQPRVVAEMYQIAVAAIAAERRIYRSIFSSPGYVLYRSVEVLQTFVGSLRSVRRIADDHAAEFSSPGFGRLFAMLCTELSDEYFEEIGDHLKRLRFRDGVLVSARLSTGNVGIDYVLRRPAGPRPGLMARLAGRGPDTFTLTIPDRDESGLRTLSELRDKGVNLVANALAQSCDHILSFFTMLRHELGFYVGCLNLRERLVSLGEPVCFPVAVAAGKQALSFDGLYDTALALCGGGGSSPGEAQPSGERVVGNDVTADGKTLVIITGANQGGKSTFLRSIGLAQLMMQCGMFVSAESFSAGVCSGLFTHYKREEDATMTSGKLDEELSRMSDIVDSIQPGGLLLANESFAATNEREGSELARHIVRALVDSGVKVFLVTHFFDLANGFYAEGLENALFLRAEREPDGRRTFRLREGGPQPTGHAADLYRQVFG